MWGIEDIEDLKEDFANAFNVIKRVIHGIIVRRIEMAEKVDYAALKKRRIHAPEAKGCFSLRVAVVGGNLTAENIKTIAEVAEEYGHGYVHMTSRQGIEIPFIKVEDINVVKQKLADGGVGTGVCGPRVRTITARQGSEICPSGCIDTYTLAKELDERYFWTESFLINLNSVSQDARITALRQRKMMSESKVA